MKKKISVFFLVMFLAFSVVNCNDVFAFRGFDGGMILYDSNPDEILIDPDFDLNSVDAGVLSSWYSSEISVPDEALKKALQNASKTDKLTVEAMFSLPTSLDLTGMNIKNLKGLEYAINVTDLDISDNEIESLDSLSNLYNLKTLNYSHNNVTKVPGWIFTSKSLISVDGSYNSSSEIESFENRQSFLKILYLENNKLTSLPDLSGLDNLETLSLANNEFSEYPSSISRLAKLKVLSLSGNKLTTIDGIAANTALSTLYINNNELEALPTDIQSLPVLTELSLSHNKITQIGEEIIQLESLERFDISFNLLKSIPQNLASLPELSVLDVNFNYISSDGDNASILKNTNSEIENFYYSLQLPEFDITLHDDFNSSSGKLKWDGILNTTSDEGSYSVSKYVIERKEYIDPTEVKKEDSDSDQSVDNVSGTDNGEDIVDTDNTSDTAVPDDTAENDTPSGEDATVDTSENEFVVIAELEPTVNEFIDDTASDNKEYVYKVSAYIEGEYKSHGKVSLVLEDSVNTLDKVSSIAGSSIWIYVALGGVVVLLLGYFVYRIIRNKKVSFEKENTESKKVSGNEKQANKIVSNEPIKTTSRSDLEDELDRILFSAKEEADRLYPEEKTPEKKQSEIGNIYEEVKKDKKSKK